MKKTWIVIMALCAAFAFTACGKASDKVETTPQTSAPQTTAEVTTEAETTSAPAEQSAPGDTAEFKLLTGKILAVSDDFSSITMKKDDSEVKLDLVGVDVETSYALEPDVEISVIYKGEISKGDTTNADVILVLDAQESLDVKTVTGSVRDQAMSSFTIQTEDGGDIGFLKDGCEGISSGVLGQGSDDGSGAMVKVTYISVAYDTGVEVNFPLKVEAAK